MFLRPFSSRNANLGWFRRLRPNGQSLFLEPIGKYLHNLGPNIAAAAKSGVRRYQDMRLKNFEAARPIDNPEPLNRMAAMENSHEPIQDLDLNLRASVADLFDPTVDLPPGLYWRRSEGIEEIRPIETAASESTADESSAPAVAVGLMSQDHSLLEGEESPVDEVIFPEQQTSTSGSESSPLMRTMVESLSTTAPEGGDTTAYLPDTLADIFVKKEIADPRVQALLRGFEHLDCQELADELREFADSIGASSAGK